MRTLDTVKGTCQERLTIGTGDERDSKNSVSSVRFDDDDVCMYTNFTIYSMFLYLIFWGVEQNIILDTLRGKLNLTVI